MLFRKLFGMVPLREGVWEKASALEKQRNQLEHDQVIKYRDLVSLKKELYNKSVEIENLEGQAREYNVRISEYQVITYKVQIKLDS